MMQHSKTERCFKHHQFAPMSADGSIWSFWHICITKSKDAPPIPRDKIVIKELYGISASNAN